ncbi:MAG: glycosyltransferase [Mucilaginibacter sp.]
MKIVILHNDFRVYWKGRLTYLRKFLDAKDIEFSAIELFGKGSPYNFDEYDNSEAWWTCLFPEKSANELSSGDIKNALFSKLDKINPDIIIGGSIVFYSGALGVRWAKQNKKKFVMFDDGKPSQIKRNFLVQWVKTLITKQIDGLWLPSKEYDSEYPGLDQGTVHFFHGYNCIDNQLFSFKNRNFNSSAIICVARLVPVKNIDNLLRSWKIVEEKKINFKLVIIGSGPEYDHLNVLSSELGLLSVEFTGAVKNEDISAYFNNADAFILPSLYESWGLVVNEAMAAGLPVLLSNRVNAHSALLKEGINGFSFDPDNINEIAEKIIKYVDLDTKSKKSMSESSLKIIDTMSYENMGKRLLTAFNKITSKKNTPTGILPKVVINLWSGRYNTAGWDKL